MNFKKREHVVKKHLLNGQAYLFTNNQDIYYLSGFYGSYGILIISKEKSLLFVDGRYFEKARKESEVDEVILISDLLNDIKKSIKQLHIKEIFFDGDSLTYNFYKNLANNLDQIKLKDDREKYVKKLREIKDEDEIKIMESAVKKSKKAFNEFIKNFIPGKREIEYVNELDYSLKKYGEGLSFDTIILSGKNSSLPHGTPSNRKIKNGDSVIIDYGLKYKNYCTDHTKTLIFDNPKMDKYLKIIKLAFDAGLKKIGDSREIKEVDIAVRNVFEKNNLLKNFLHSSGHGIGLSVHESPTLSYKTEGTFKEGMVVTLEPGLYFEGQGGIRYEEMILVTKKGCEIL